MYNDITDIYNEIFPLNQDFLAFLPEYLGPPNSRVLDLGCGAGAYVHALSNSGYQATGIDASTEMIRQAQAALDGRFYPYGFSEINKLQGPFECAFCVGNSLSYLPNIEMRPFFESLSQLLTPNAFFILQVINWDRYRLTGTKDFPIKTLQDGRTFHRKYEKTGTAHIIFHTEIRSGNQTQQAWSDPLFPKHYHELSEALCTARFTVVESFGDYHQSPFNATSSPAMILVAQNTRTESS